MSVTIKELNLLDVISKASECRTNMKTAVVLTAREDCKPYVPYEDGALRTSAETESVPEEGQLVWGNARVPYAAAQYYGLPNKTTPKTCNQWFEDAFAAHKTSWINVAKAEAKKVFDA